MKENPTRDWKVFLGNGQRNSNLLELPPPPPWRFAKENTELKRPGDLNLEAEAKRAAPFLPSPEMILAVNAALYLRRPLLITGKPGIGKSTLISKVADELQLGPVLRWPINSRSTVRNGVYEYDAVGRLQAGKKEPPVQKYLTLGPLGTALIATTWPRPLLIDEIDKSDLDFANDLLNVIEEGIYDIPELRRLGSGKCTVDDFLGNQVEISGGRIQCGQFPFVIMTSNAEREFPPPFLRRCVRLNVDPPKPEKLAEIVEAQLKHYMPQMEPKDVKGLITEFDQLRNQNIEVATDQLLNAVFLTIAMRDVENRKFDDEELKALKRNLFRALGGALA